MNCKTLTLDKQFYAHDCTPNCSLVIIEQSVCIFLNSITGITKTSYIAIYIYIYIFSSQLFMVPVCTFAMYVYYEFAADLI